MPALSLCRRYATGTLPWIRVQLPWVTKDSLQVQGYLELFGVGRNWMDSLTIPRGGMYTTPLRDTLSELFLALALDSWMTQAICGASELLS